MERTVATAIESLGEAGFQSASHQGMRWEADQRLMMEEVIELALKDEYE
jgi:hypothetical protein